MSRSARLALTTSVGPRRRQAAVLTMLSSYTTTAFGIVTSLILVPLYMRYFSLGTYGAWLASGGVVSMLGIADAGLTQVIGQRMAAREGAADREGFVRTCGSGWLLIGAACAIIIAGGLGIAPWVPGWIRASAEDVPDLCRGFVFATIGSALSLVQQNVFSCAVAWQRTGAVAVVALCSLIAGVVTTLVALNVGLGVSALGLAVLVKGLVGLALAIGHVGQGWRQRGLKLPRIDGAELRTQLRLTAPLFVGRTGGILLSQSEPALVSALMGPQSAAVLALTGKVFSVVQSLVNPIAGGAFMPLAHLAAAAPKSRVQEVVGELFELSSLCAAVATAGALALNGPFMRLWTGSETYGGPALSAALGLCALVVIRLNLLGMILAGLGKVGVASVGGLVELPIRIGLLYTLVPRLGMLGLPCATLLASASVTLWYLPYCLGVWLEVRGRTMVHMLLRGWQPTAVALSLGLLIAAALGRMPSGRLNTWPRFAMATSFVGAAVTLCIWAASPMARALVRKSGRYLVPKRAAS